MCLPPCTHQSDLTFLFTYSAESQGWYQPVDWDTQIYNMQQSTGEQDIWPPFLVNEDEQYDWFAWMQMSRAVWDFLVYSRHPYRVDNCNTRSIRDYDLSAVTATGREGFPRVSQTAISHWLLPMVWTDEIAIDYSRCLDNSLTSRLLNFGLLICMQNDALALNLN